VTVLVPPFRAGHPSVGPVTWSTTGPPDREGRRPERFLLDLSGVSFVDVTGMHALERIDEVVRDHGSRLDVIGPTARGPGRLLNLAVDRGWLPCAFASSVSVDRVT
jgi:hypothetical protein